MNNKKKCQICNVIYSRSVDVRDNQWKSSMYCSRECTGISKRANAGRVGYRALHDWIERELGRPTKCEFCGVEKSSEDRRRGIQWANIDHQYKRDINDYLALCTSCHAKYDKALKKEEF